MGPSFGEVRRTQDDSETMRGEFHSRATSRELLATSVELRVGLNLDEMERWYHSSSMLEVRSIRKSYGKIVAVEGVSLDAVASLVR